jgi:hypothetical protein
VDIEGTSDTGGGNNVGWIADGEWLEYTVDVASSGLYDVEVRVASLSNGGVLHVEMDGLDVTGAMIFAATGGWQNWTSVTASDVSLTAGQHIMRLSMDADLFNVNWVRFTSALPTPTPTPTPGSVGLLVNGGFENGTTGWIGNGCTIAPNTTNNHSGAGSVEAYNRSASWAGPQQDITSALQSNGPGVYTLEAWIRRASGSGTGKVTVAITDSSGTSYYGVECSTSTSWSQCSGTQNLTWSGTLLDAAFFVETPGSTDTFYVDDCSLHR